MRIALVNRFGRVAGGAETYLQDLLAILPRRGHDALFLYEVDEPFDHGRVEVPKTIDAVPWSHEYLKTWRPDVIFAHGDLSAQTENALLETAPAVYFAHDYHGTCISGLKTWKIPTPSPCSEKFGARCLLNYFPRRCGGSNPVSMLRLYSEQKGRLARLRRYRAIVTHSEHMRCEYVKHGFSANSVFSFLGSLQPAPSHPASWVPVAELRNELRILYVGRMYSLKGGDLLLKALPLVRAQLQKPIRLRLVGDGPARAAWQQIAGKLASISVEFVGWQTAMQKYWRDTDLLVVPSVWPEPFGRVGLEAGSNGVPVAAFRVGGIGDWLEDGFNGYSASAMPPNEQSLAEAIVKCFCHPMGLDQLRQGARVMAARYEIGHHVEMLEHVFQKVAAA